MLTCKWTVFVCKKVCTVNSFMHVVCKIYAWNRLYKLSWIALLDCCHLCRTVVNVGIMWGPWIASELFCPANTDGSWCQGLRSLLCSRLELCVPTDLRVLSLNAAEFTKQLKTFSFSRLVYHIWGLFTHAHTRLTAFCPGLPGWASIRKVKPIWILLKKETVSGSGVSWTVCKSVSSSRQITTSAPRGSVFYRPDALPVAQPTALKHWGLSVLCYIKCTHYLLLFIDVACVLSLQCCDTVGWSSGRASGL